MRIGARGQVEVVHCGQPMTWLGTSTSWVGKPGQGSQDDRVQWECAACGARVTVEQREPDQGQDPRHLRAV